jgi:predicted ATP-dependent endonuclease of OLD family
MILGAYDSPRIKIGGVLYMAIRKCKLENFTVFDTLKMEFCNGINIFIGENGTGKTHIMKVLYSACQASRKDISFSQKMVGVFKPDESNINRLVKRGKGVATALVEVYSESASIKLKFSTKTNKWDALTTGETNWEKQNDELISTYIPAKEILSNAYQFEAAYLKNNIDFDETYVDIITAAKIDINRGPNPPQRKKYLDQLNGILKGSVTIDNEKFYLKPGTQAKLEFHLVAEGIRKLALLWQLIKNGTLEKGTILFWDEPEANLNPVVIPVLVDILLQLQKDGVQIFIATHDYILAKYFEVKVQPDNDIMFYSFYEDEQGKVRSEKNQYFRDLATNPIIRAFNNLLDQVIDKNVGD